MSPAEFKVYFITEHRQFFNKNHKKQKNDYVLNMDKIIRDKFGSDIYILNATQAFLLNYEIKKLLDKAINIKNRKYTNIVYINKNMRITSIMNTKSFLEASYPEMGFEYILCDEYDDFLDIQYKDGADDIEIVKGLN